MASRAGMRVGNYELIEEVGHGSMGVVFKARQLSMDRVVALKVLPRRLARNEEFVARFIAEARAAGKLSHLNIVQVHDVGNDGDTYFFSMEFVDGGTAFEIMHENGPFSEAETIDIARQIAEALDLAHSRGIVHRDVKPDNFMIDQKGTAKLADLGLARVGPGDEEEVGQAYGTPYYMSPEQARGQPADARSDLYSLGASIYHMVAGKLPFEGATPAAVMAKHVSEEPPPLTRVAKASKELVAIVGKLMRKDPAQRYQQAKELVAALEKLQHGSTTNVLATKSRASLRRRRPAPRGGGGGAQAVAGLVGVAVIAAVAYVFLVGNKRPDRDAVTRRTEAVDAEDPADDRALLKFNALSDWAKSSPDSLAEITTKFDAFAREFPASSLAEEAGKRARKARDELALKELVKSFDDAKERASSLVSRGNYGGAVRALEDFALSASRQDIAASARAEAAEARKKAGSAFDEILRASRSLEAEGKFALARRELEKALVFGLDDVAARATEEISALARRKNEAALKKEQEALDSAVLKAAELVSGRSFDEAVKELEAVVGKLSGERRRRASERAEDLKLVAKVWSDALVRLRARRVPLVTIGLKEQGSVISADERGIEIRKGSGSALRAWDQFSPESVFKLVEAALAARDGMEHLGLAALAVELDLIEEAGGQLRSAATAGVAGETYSRYRRLVDGELVSAREANAARLFERAKEVPRRERAETLRRLLTRYAETDFVKKHRAEIEALAGAKKEEKKDTAEPERDATQELARLGWNVVKGKWTVKGKNVFLGKEGPLMLQAGDDTWADAAVQLKAQLSKGEEFSVVVRYNVNLVAQVERILQTIGDPDDRGGGRGQIGAWRRMLTDSLAPFPGYGVKVTGDKLQAFDAGRPPAGLRGATGAWGQNTSRLPTLVVERRIARGSACEIGITAEGDKLQIFLNRQRIHSAERPKLSSGPVVIEAPEEVELLIQRPAVRKLK